MPTRLTLRARVAISAAVMTALLVAIVGVLIASARTADRHAEHQASAADVRVRAQSAEKLILDVETGQRGFILTGAPAFLEPWRTGRARFPPEARRLVTLSRGDAQAADLAARIESEGVDYIEGYNAPLVETARQDREAALRTVRTGEGKRRVDRLRGLFDRYLERQDRIYAASRRSAASALDRAVTIGIAGLVLALLLMGAATVMLERSVLRPVGRLRSAARRLEEGALHARVPEKGAPELAELGRGFNAMAVALEESRESLLLRAEELERSRTSAEAASRAKSEFLSRVSHELRTPLNAILGFGQLLEISDLQPADRQSVEQIMRAARSLLALVDQVLELAALDAGRAAVSLESVRVAPLLEKVSARMEPIAAQRSVSVRASVPAGLTARADPRRLERIIAALVSNAVRFNREGGEVRLSAERAPDGGVRILVSDTGPGIPDEQLPALFDAFDRRGADEDAQHGTGLGLALARGQAELMGARLGVVSSPGHGATFHVDLPPGGA